MIHRLHITCLVTRPTNELNSGVRQIHRIIRDPVLAHPCFTAFRAVIISGNRHVHLPCSWL